MKNFKITCLYIFTCFLGVLHSLGAASAEVSAAGPGGDTSPVEASGPVSGPLSPPVSTPVSPPVSTPASPGLLSSMLAFPGAAASAVGTGLYNTASVVAATPGAIGSGLYAVGAGTVSVVAATPGAIGSSIYAVGAGTANVAYDANRAAWRAAGYSLPMGPEDSLSSPTTEEVPAEPSPGWFARLPGLNVMNAVQSIREYLGQATEAVIQRTIRAYVETTRYPYPYNTRFYEALDGYSSAFKYLDASSQGDPVAKAYKAVLVSLGLCIAQDMDAAKALAAEARTKLEEWSVCSIADAKLALAILYESGLINTEGTDRYAEATRYYQAAVDQVSVDAMYLYALYYVRNVQPLPAMNLLDSALGVARHPYILYTWSILHQGKTKFTSSPERAAIKAALMDAAKGEVMGAKVELAHMYLDEAMRSDGPAADVASPRERAKALLMEAQAKEYAPAFAALGELAYEEAKYSDALTWNTTALSLLPAHMVDHLETTEYPSIYRRGLSFPRDSGHLLDHLIPTTGKIYFNLWLLGLMGHIPAPEAAAATAHASSSTAVSWAPPNRALELAAILKHAKAIELMSPLVAAEDSIQQANFTKIAALRQLALAHYEGTDYMPKDLEAAWILASEAAKIKDDTEAKYFAGKIKLTMLGKLQQEYSTLEAGKADAKRELQEEYTAEISTLLRMAAQQKGDESHSLHADVTSKGIEAVARELYAAYDPNSAPPAQIGAHI